MQEEFYDFEQDPNGLINLISNPEYAEDIQELRRSMEEWMARIGDPALDALRNRASRPALDQFMASLDREIGRREMP